ncbi:MAG: hypothetical protein ACOY3P_00190 [Planctomycetota bacterium]
MSPRFSFFAVAIVLLCSFGVAEAQVGRGGAGKGEPQHVDGEGTLVAAAPGKLQIKMENGRPMNFLVAQNARVEFKGTAVPSFLRPGMWVKFDAELDKHGAAQGEVAVLTLFTPSNAQPPGIWPQDPGGGIDNADEAGKKKGPTGPHAGLPDAITPCSIAGQISAIGNRQISVRTGRVGVKATIAEDAQIDVETEDLTFARPGDGISFRAAMTRQGVPQVTRMTVKAAQPLAPPQPPPGQEKSRRGPAEKQADEPQ